MIISLCGFMGAGKSTLGKNLARYTGARFIDLDEYLEKKLGCTVGSFFTQQGEPAFRAEELGALKEIIDQEQMLTARVLKNKIHSSGIILSLGGGTVTTEACATLIKQHTRCIYLKCPKNILLKRLIKNSNKRPLLVGKNNAELDTHITSLMEKREPLYNACAHAIFEILPRESISAALERISVLL